MVYGVFENMIGDLEELERREIIRSGQKRGKLSRSDVHIPSMAHKTDENVSLWHFSIFFANLFYLISTII